jgi:arylsulfate sulfotransferase
MNLKLKGLIFIILIILVIGCKKKADNDDNNPPVDNPTSVEITNQNITLNPSGYSPLTATIGITVNPASKVSIRVIGKNGYASDVIKNFDTISTNHNLTILGLYADYLNSVEMTFYDQSGKNLGVRVVTIQTAPLSQELPLVSINTSLPGKKPGMTLVSYMASYNLPNLKMPFIFDEFGYIRWYLDYSSHPILSTLKYGNGLDRLKNGNFYFFEETALAIFEVNMFGQILNSWPLSGYTFHHHVLEKPNGNFLVTVNKLGLTTTQDHVIEIDRITKQIIKVWDLRQSLQAGRTAWVNLANDWLHLNSVEYDQSDNTIIVSGRHQGVAKLDDNNNVIWIMAPHKGWGLAGDGSDLTTKLLQPLNAANQIITDTSIINGYTNSPDFEWNWYQHAVKLMPNGDISMFDNGDNRNFVYAGPYSRAVTFRIDKVNMTVKQLWQYGKERGVETYSRMLSDVTYIEDVNHIIFSSGTILSNGRNGKVIELEYNTSTPIFEATISHPSSTASYIFHRTKRLNLYAD